MKKQKIFYILLPAIIGLVMECNNRTVENTNGIIAVIDSFQYPEPVHAPFDFPEIKVPDIPDRRYSIIDYGAQSGGSFDCSKAIKDAIAAASRKGGGVIVFPEGEWLTGPIHLESNINLYLEEGARVLFSQNFSDYLPVVFWRHEGIEVYSYSPFIYALDKENIAITGKGEFNGQGEAWWIYRFTENQKYYSGSVNRLQKMGEDGVPVEERVFDSLGYKFLCPPFVAPVRCKNIWIEGVTFKYGAFWTIVPTYCENVVVRNINVETYGDYGHTPNGDGVNPSSCKNVLIENCILNTGDDCIAIKSGKNRDGRRVGIPTENVVVRNIIGFKGHGGVVIGSEISGGVENVYAYNCNFNGTDRIIRIKSERGRGGYVKNCWYENMHADTIEREAIHINLLYSGRRLPEGNLDETTPVFENIYIKNVTCRFSKRNAIQILGIPESRVKNVHIDSVNITSKKGIDIWDAQNIHLSNIYVDAVTPGVLQVAYSDSIWIDGLMSIGNDSEDPLITIFESGNILLRSIEIKNKPLQYVEISGSKTNGIILDKNSIQETNVRLGKEVSKTAYNFEQ